MKDLTWCISSSCTSICERHISNYDAEPGEMVSISDFSGICRNYIQQVIEEVEDEDN